MVFLSFFSNVSIAYRAGGVGGGNNYWLGHLWSIHGHTQGPMLY